MWKYQLRKSQSIVWYTKCVPDNEFIDTVSIADWPLYLATFDDFNTQDSFFFSLYFSDAVPMTATVGGRGLSCLLPPSLELKFLVNGLGVIQFRVFFFFTFSPVFAPTETLIPFLPWWTEAFLHFVLSRKLSILGIFG